MGLSSSVKISLAILALVLVYFGVHSLFGSETTVDEEVIGPVLFHVIAEEVQSEPRQDVVKIRGRSEAARKVTVRAETPGMIEATPTKPGTHVKKGDVLCQLREDARRANLNEARAAQKRAKLDYDAAARLAEEGFRAETSLAAVRAALDLASARVEQTELELDRIKITAPFDGVFDDRLAEAGDFLRVGEACGVLIQQSPFLIVGAVAERDVAKIKVGDKGIARLVTGEEVEGVLRFVATSADEATRTFDVELEVPNTEGTLRDGVTAEFEVFASSEDAYLMPRSALTLDDAGKIGVRTVDGKNIVGFAPIRIVGESDNGVWVAGPTGTFDVITRGQDFVRAGQEVVVVKTWNAIGAN